MVRHRVVVWVYFGLVCVANGVHRYHGEDYPRRRRPRRSQSDQSSSFPTTKNQSKGGATELQESAPEEDAPERVVGSEQDRHVSDGGDPADLCSDKNSPKDSEVLSPQNLTQTSKRDRVAAIGLIAPV